MLGRGTRINFGRFFFKFRFFALFYIRLTGRIPREVSDVSFPGECVPRATGSSTHSLGTGFRGEGANMQIINYVKKCLRTEPKIDIRSQKGNLLKNQTSINTSLFCGIVTKFF